MFTTRKDIHGFASDHRFSDSLSHRPGGARRRGSPAEFRHCPGSGSHGKGARGTRNRRGAIIGTLALAGLLVGAAFAPARAVVISTNCASLSCSLDELFNNGGSLQVNDKLFSNWTIGANTTDVPNLLKTEVNGLDNGGIDPGPGLNYDISFVGVAGVGTETVAWGYDVTVLDPNRRIKDNSLGALEIVIGTGRVSVIETLFDAAGTQIGTKECTTTVTQDAFNPPCDTLTFAPVGFLHVETVIFLEGTDANGFVQVEFLEQRYSQTVPEPGTFAMFALGLAGLGFMRRRRVA